MTALTRRHWMKLTAAAAGAAAAQPGGPLVIDCHTHAGTATALTAPWTTIADPEEILRRNDEAGIHKACIFPISHETFREANEEIARIVRRHPDRFIGFAKHDPVREKGQVRQMLRHECLDLGLRGLKLHVTPTAETLEAVEELGIPVLWHPSPNVATFEGVIKNYPKIDFILAHMGSDLSANWREHEAAIGVARNYPNVYLDTGGTVLTRYIEQAVKDPGPRKIVYGSDEPEVDCRLEIFKVRVLKLAKADEQAILGGNMQRLLGRYRGGSA